MFARVSDPLLFDVCLRLRAASVTQFHRGVRFSCATGAGVLISGGAPLAKRARGSVGRSRETSVRCKVFSRLRLQQRGWIGCGFRRLAGDSRVALVGHKAW